jgi:hypothetical protein
MADALSWVADVFYFSQGCEGRFFRLWAALRTKDSQDPKLREIHPPSLKAEVAVKAQSIYGGLSPGCRAMRLRRA